MGGKVESFEARAVQPSLVVFQNNANTLHALIDHQQVSQHLAVINVIQFQLTSQHSAEVEPRQAAEILPEEAPGLDLHTFDVSGRVRLQIAEYSVRVNTSSLDVFDSCGIGQQEIDVVRVAVEI